MRRALPLIAIATLACADASSPPATAPVFENGAIMLRAVQAGSAGTNFVTQLSGGEEVPMRETSAHGVASFRLSKDGQSVCYKLNVANINNVVAAHIHIGAAGANGPVTVFLAGPYSPGGGSSDGRLSEGCFTAANLLGPLAGGTIEDLIAQIQAGNAYVNVHTNDGVGSPNTGPGDFPGGEVRGQIDTGSGFHH